MQWISLCVNLRMITSNPHDFFQIHSVCFHSTHISLGKWKTKGYGNHKKYSVGAKRTDARRALKDIYSESSGRRAPREKSIGDGRIIWDDDRYCSNSQPKDSQPQSDLGKGRAYGRIKWERKKRDKKLNDFYHHYYGDPDWIFREAYVESFTWSFQPKNEVKSDLLKKKNILNTTGESRNENDSDGVKEKPPHVSSSSNRTSKKKEKDSADGVKEKLPNLRSISSRSVLGLPFRGPLKIDDIKSAFRSSALKWHPDKHQTPTQRKAAEKFKQCYEAYQYLCKELDSP